MNDGNQTRRNTRKPRRNKYQAQDQPGRKSRDGEDDLPPTATPPPPPAPLPTPTHHLARTWSKKNRPSPQPQSRACSVHLPPPLASSTSPHTRHTAGWLTPSPARLDTSACRSVYACGRRTRSICAHRQGGGGGGVRHEVDLRAQGGGGWARVRKINKSKSPRGRLVRTRGTGGVWDRGTGSANLFKTV